MVSGQVFPSEISDTKNTVGIAVQLSAASVTTETSGAGTSPTHSTVSPIGFEAVGGVISLTVMVWVTFIELPQSSVTLYVRVMVSGQVFPSEASETNETIGIAVQLSAASVTTETSAAGTSLIQSTVIPAGFEAVGGVISLTVMVWVTFIELPQSSDTLYVRVMFSGQVFPSETSDTNATTTGQSLTIFVTELISLTGKSDIH